ncbi:MAG: dihydroorotase [Chitinophagaceae bacterium]|nr:dihydroorotase [Chitinophagaceae bacterium]
MQNTLFKNISVVNENKIETMDVLVRSGRIEKLAQNISVKERVKEIPGDGLHLFPGVIDDQVHFREPGLTHKATIFTESRAAVAGGVTSFMEMPNTIPNALTHELLEDKYLIGQKDSLANYSFFMGTSNTNAEEVLKTNQFKKNICGVKIFMGSSTGNMLVDSEPALHQIFRNSELLIATHCEDEKTIRKNYEALKQKKPDLQPSDHPLIRNTEGCYLSSSFASSLAKKYQSRLHILHITTSRELALFRNDIPLKEKKITAEVCVHHLHFTADDYERLGYLIKCNPAIKESQNRDALWNGLLDNHLDVIATDHAPHLLEEKQPPYEKARSGMPLVQHGLLLMLHYYKQGKISLEKIAEKMSHAVADCFLIENRGYIREGYFADFAVVNLNEKTTVTPENILYKCKWSPLMDMTFSTSIEMTFVNGNCVFERGKLIDSSRGSRLTFAR